MKPVDIMSISHVIKENLHPNAKQTADFSDKTVMKPYVILVIASIVQLCQLTIRIPVRGPDLTAAQNWDISLIRAK